MHAFHRCLTCPRWLFWSALFLPIAPWAAHTNARIRSVYSFGLHAPSSLHVWTFGAVRPNNNHWNATMSHSKVSFKAYYHPPLPPSRTNPHIFSRQNEVVKLPLRYSFFQKHSLILQSFWTNITLAGSFEGVFTSLLCGHLFFGGQLVYFEAPWKDVTKWVLLVQLYSWAWLGLLLGLQSAFWSCWGQTLVSPPCVSYITSTNTSKQAGLEINLSSGQRFLPVRVDSWHMFHIYTWKIYEIV